MDFSEKFDSLTHVELNNLKTKLGSQMQKLNKKIAERKKYLKEVRIPGLTYAPDETLESMRHELAQIQEESYQLKVYKKAKAGEIEAARLKSELELRKAQDEALKYDRYRERLADERRPKGERVWMGTEFRKLRPAEKRLIMLMAREIGQQRFQELRRIAFYDEKHKKNFYYTGTKEFNGGEGAYEQETNTTIQ